MRQKLSEFFIGGDRFKNEFREQLRLLIVFTFGFTIAFTWRQTLFDTTESIIRFITNIQSSTYLSIISSITITLFSLLVIYLSAKYLKG